jgi:hypothetical protein
MAMTNKANKSTRRSRIDDGFDLDALLHPAGAFASPIAVVHDPDLTLNEKRAILASWASDACAVEAAPELRRPPGGRIIRFEEVIDALRMLDAQTAMSTKPEPNYRRVLRKRRILRRRDRGSGDGSISMH